MVAASEALFGRGALEELSPATLAAAVAEIPGTSISSQQVDAGITIVELLVAAGLCSSRSDARRAIEQGGVYVNNAKVSDDAATLSRDQLLGSGVALLRRGKRALAAARLH